jgi:hypothetical protein
MFCGLGARLGRAGEKEKGRLGWKEGGVSDGLFCFFFSFFFNSFYFLFKLLLKNFFKNFRQTFDHTINSKSMHST